MIDMFRNKNIFAIQYQSVEITELIPYGRYAPSSRSLLRSVAVSTS